ncbi:hypothetical protein [Alienimonas sp. DA493]|uniref:hypothetical protein n=1 Tax=Alienimonas sp. DA493 TaxID=3373605 RepID=UPI003754C34A
MSESTSAPGPDATPEELADALRDDEAATEAARRLGELGAGARPVVPALAAALHSARPKAVRLAAARALENLADEAEAAYVALERASASDDNEVAGAARAALNAIGGGEYT